jgi:hypothetical protein
MDAGTFDVEDLAAIATAVASIFAVLLVGITLQRASPEALGSRRGWVLVAFGVSLFATRTVGHFVDAAWFQAARPALGFAGAALLFLGFFLLFRETARKEGRAA